MATEEDLLNAVEDALEDPKPKRVLAAWHTRRRQGSLAFAWGWMAARGVFPAKADKSRSPWTWRKEENAQVAQWRQRADVPLAHEERGQLPKAIFDSLKKGTNGGARRYKTLAEAAQDLADALAFLKEILTVPTESNPTVSPPTPSGEA